SIDGGKEASIKKPKDLSKTKNVKKIQKPVRPKTDKVIKPAPKKDTEIIPNINKGSESDSSTQCPHCKSKVTTEDKTNVDCPKCNKLFFEDERDGNIYKAVRIGDQIWMAENFRFEEIKGSWCYDNKKVNCKKYGRLYNWETAMKISPKGWHLPSIDEWEKLIEYCGSRDAGKNLKSRSGWHKEGNGVDKFNFSALPGGYYSSDGKFDSLEWSANFLVSTKCDSHKIWNIDLYAVFDFVKENNLASIDNGNSVRYIKD
ncbi:MAG: fibrobacter succinogenes major paralogous domain-containing protein, partial [Candidatus Zophobacter franzmannii]|nr:fibrobacter succinogenes major paralogous domain-containing protein [Candidatus Zophobacter franzmannii]